MCCRNQLWSGTTHSSTREPSTVGNVVPRFVSVRIRSDQQGAAIRAAQ
ncbi:MAG TPA: hypothetical protein VFG33_02590 [Kribbella sp.]|nr:hypothetical protein [Kribbella sp.]HET6292226.1 hypothetical protein [Kribbella sp.]